MQAAPHHTRQKTVLYTAVQQKTSGLDCAFLGRFDGFSFQYMAPDLRSKLSSSIIQMPRRFVSMIEENIMYATKLLDMLDILGIYEGAGVSLVRGRRECGVV